METRNVQVIDGAANCTYEIYAVPLDVFDILFPEPGQDLEFVEDVAERLPKDKRDALSRLYAERLDRRSVRGIHGTLFVQLLDRKRWFPNKTWDGGDILAALYSAGEPS